MRLALRTEDAAFRTPAARTVAHWDLPDEALALGAVTLAVGLVGLWGVGLILEGLRIGALHASSRSFVSVLRCVVPSFTLPLLVAAAAGARLLLGRPSAARTGRTIGTGIVVLALVLAPLCICWGPPDGWPRDMWWCADVPCALVLTTLVAGGSLTRAAASAEPAELLRAAGLDPGP